MSDCQHGMPYGNCCQVPYNDSREKLLEDWLRRISDRLEKSADVLNSSEATQMQRHNYAMMAKHYIQTMTYATGVKLT